MSHEFLLLLLGALLFSGILCGVPVSFVLFGAPALVAFLGAGAGAFDMAFLDAFPSRAFGLLTNPVFLSVPLFVAMGGLLEKSGIARRMMLAAGALFGEARGGMAYAVIVVGALLAASTGVIGATIFMLGLIALPAMLSANYSPRLSAGVICASGSLGQIIPPSILLILLADQVSGAYQAGRRSVGDFAADPVSVGDLFAGALLPGLMLVGLYLLYVLGASILNPDSCPPVREGAAGEGGEREGGERPGAGEAARALLPPLALILLVLGSILGGVATPTESAALGAAGALAMVAMEAKAVAPWPRALLRAVLPCAALLVAVRAMGGASASPILMGIGALALAGFLGGLLLALWREAVHGDLGEALSGCASMVAMLVLIVLGATMLSLVFRGLGGDEMVSGFLHGLPGGAATALFAVMAVIFALGFVIEYVEIIFIVVPVAGPPLMAAGVDPVWFAVLISMNLQISFLTPPFGYALFYFRSVAPPQLPTREVYASIVPFVLLQLLALALVAGFPSIATWLPGAIYD